RDSIGGIGINEQATLEWARRKASLRQNICRRFKRSQRFCHAFHESPEKPTIKLLLIRVPSKNAFAIIKERQR
ncbi:hypothetical protein, partial [Rhizobium tropici]|uniref:hypothetical protein n=1 Tax=Rhizobium tropici TaxID=398 RepID=UPI00165F7F97